MVTFRGSPILINFGEHKPVSHMSFMSRLFARLNQLDRSWGGIAAVNLCTMSDFYSAQSCPIHNFMWGTSKRPLQEFTAECRYLSDQKQTNLTRRHRFKLTATSCCVSFIVCSCCYTSWKRCRRHGDSAFVQLSSQMSIVKGSFDIAVHLWRRIQKWSPGKPGNTEKSWKIMKNQQIESINLIQFGLQLWSIQIYSVSWELIVSWDW